MIVRLNAKRRNAFEERRLDPSSMQPRAAKFQWFYTELDSCLLSVDIVKDLDDHTIIGSRRYIAHSSPERVEADRRQGPSSRISVGEAARPGPDPSGTRSQPCFRMRSIHEFWANGSPRPARLVARRRRRSLNSLLAAAPPTSPSKKGTDRPRPTRSSSWPPSSAGKSTNLSVPVSPSRIFSLTSGPSPTR